MWDYEQGPLGDVSTETEVSDDDYAEVVFSSVIAGYDTSTDKIEIGTEILADTYRSTNYYWNSIYPEYIPQYAYDNSLTTIIDLGDDEGAFIELPLWGGAGEQPFVRYYGKCHDSVFVSSNGFLLFGQPVPTDENGRTTDPFWTRPINGAISGTSNTMPNGVVAPYWRDLKPDDNTEIKCGIMGPPYFTYPHFVILWENIPSAKGKVQNFGVAMQVTTKSIPTPMPDSSIKFIYRSICLEYEWSSRDKTWYPIFSIGMENQFGTRYTNLNDKFSEIGQRNKYEDEERMVSFDGDSANSYGIESVIVWACKWAEDPETGQISDDPAAEIHVSNQYGPGRWPSQNTQPDFEQPSEDELADSIVQLLTSTGVATLATLVGCPYTGVLISACGLVYQTYSYVRDAKATDPTVAGALDSDEHPTGQWAYASDVACDGVGQRPYESGDVMIAPRFEWALGEMTPDTLCLDRFISFHAYVAYRHLGGGDNITILTESIRYRINNGLVFTDVVNFEKNLMDGWTAEGGGDSYFHKLRSYNNEPDIFQTTYDDYNLDGWEKDEDGGIVTLDVDNIYRPSLRFENTQDVGPLGASIRWKGQNDYFQVSLRMMVDGRSPDPDSAYFYLTEESIDRTCIVFENNWIHYKDNGGLHQIIPFTKEQWYYITMDVWPREGSYSISTGGTLRVEDASMLYAEPDEPDWPHHDIDHISFEIGEGSDCVLLVDDIRACSDSALRVYWTGTSYIQLISPEMDVDRTDPYGISFNFYPLEAISTTNMVLADDGMFELKYTGEEGMLKAMDGGKLLNVRPMSPGEWHRIVVKVYPSVGEYIVTVDDYDDEYTFNRKPYYGPYDKLTLFFGSVTQSSSGFHGYGEWDDIVVADTWHF